MQVFWQVNQSLQGKYTHSGHFRKQLTGYVFDSELIVQRYKVPVLIKKGARFICSLVLCSD